MPRRDAGVAAEGVEEELVAHRGVRRCCELHDAARVTGGAGLRGVDGLGHGVPRPFCRAAFVLGPLIGTGHDTIGAGPTVR
ncbi:hypothetical protein Cus16_2888 [Curtobacterium sp. ER1/6]|nr:hypothetical protein Cus16_2888 [Curtobacterium sp. ER1/6]